MQTLKLPSSLNKKKKKSHYIPENLGLITTIGISGIILLLAFKDRLSPLGFAGILLFHLLIVIYTKYSEFNPPPILHFLRSYQGLIIMAPFLSGFSYYFTYFSGGFSPNAQNLAQFCVISTYFMLIWAAFAAISFIGFYFAILSIYRWFPFFVQLSVTFNSPLIIYIISVLIGLMGVGCWITFGHALFSTIFQTQDFKGKSREFKKLGWIFLFTALVCSIIFVLIEPTIWQWVQNIEIGIT
ncbi:MAG: hypothetical protein K9W44_07260 [Candidatus Lokiarchaeota archaeon]|nr:hypothetical protein [Candidatus Harpocratesius repetitus]